MASIHLPELYDEQRGSGDGANGQLRPAAAIDALINQEGYAFLDRYARACRQPDLAVIADGRVAHGPQPAPPAALASYADLYRLACDHWTHWLPAEGEVIKACMEVVRKRHVGGRLAR
ncbi:hypothetical protein GGF32_005386 [Allomyces javanicus]|nr:hypothetical protein GGF32_005386 [Allomyces javanicus]